MHDKLDKIILNISKKIMNKINDKKQKTRHSKI